MTTSFTKDQLLAYLDVVDFINDPLRKYHRISGGAGSGKTFFICHMLNKLKQDQINNYNYHLTATTNKAAAVLSNHVLNYDIKTIYSFMNLRVYDDYLTGATQITSTRNWTIHDKAFIIIDEASMVNKSLKHYIDIGTNNNCKILFVGDKNQLAPVGEPISPVYNNNVITESILTSSIRNKNQPALIDLCSQSVKTVETKEFFKIKEVPGVIDFIDGNQMKGILEREYISENPNNIILAYTNEKVIAYNDHIKNLRGYTEKYNINEIVFNNSSMESINKNMIHTDQVLKILGKSEIFTNKIQGVDIEFQDLTLQDINTFALYDLTVFINNQTRLDLINFYKKEKDWNNYFLYKNNYPDLRSNSSLTIHKAQGSTYESVIVDLTDIGKCKNKDQAARLLYVAYSRPSTRLYIRGELPERFFK